MFRSAILKLTLWYLAIIMIISVGFSIVLFNIHKRDIDASLYRQSAALQRQFMPGRGGPGSGLILLPDIETLRENVLQESLHYIELRLLYLNLGLLCIGGYLSYLLAKQTLQPIKALLDERTRFTADASHELRTPLAVMQTETEVAMRDHSLTLPQAKAVLRSNLEEIDRLTVLSRELLKLSRQENPLSKEFKEINVLNVLEEVIKEMAPLAKKANLKLDFEGTQVKIQADEAALHELLVILIDNAIKYGADGGRIELRLREERGEAVIEVKDFGKGIPADELPHIFDRFYRGKTDSHERIDGHGLGLAIAQKIAERHHGHLTAHSTLGEQTVFTVSLPLKPTQVWFTT